MQKKQLSLLAILVIAGIALYSLDSQHQPNQEFEEWKGKYAKSYAPEEEAYRLAIWLKTLEFVESHNLRYKAGIETYEVQMNAFADLTQEQFSAAHLISFPQSITSNCTGKQAPTDNLPEEVDWSTKDVVTHVKNQGQCGSCWAFSTTGSLQGLYALKNKEQKSFSEQQLVDCSKSYGNQGCNGGLMNLSFFYVQDHGITEESKYPYHGTNGKCNYKDQDAVFKNTDCTQVTAKNEKALLGAIAQQPVSVAIQANQIGFQTYKRGVFSGLCGHKLDHGVLAVGYGTSNGKGYIKVKNSWGGTWGDKGYILLERKGDGNGQCGINLAASFPV